MCHFLVLIIWDLRDHWWLCCDEPWIVDAPVDLLFMGREGNESYNGAAQELSRTTRTIPIQYSRGYYWGEKLLSGRSTESSGGWSSRNRYTLA